MKSVKETLDDAKMITSFTYNSLKVVNLKSITRFATKFISIKNLVRYKQDLKRMYTRGHEFNKEKSRSVRDKIFNLILTD